MPAAVTGRLADLTVEKVDALLHENPLSALSNPGLTGE
jgi:hypothetical protein